MHDRQQAFQRQTAGGGYHVLLGDAAFDESIRQRRLERFDTAVRQQIGIEDDDIRTSAGDLQQLVSVRHDQPFRVRGRRPARQRRLSEAPAAADRASRAGC